MRRQTELYAFAVKLQGRPEFSEVSRRWCKIPERTENWKSLHYMLENWEEVTTIQVRKVTPRF